jgi:hypothetical protein
MYLVFQKSSASLREWLQLDFDEDANMLAQINSGEFGMATPIDDLPAKISGRCTYLKYEPTSSVKIKHTLLN